MHERLLTARQPSRVRVLLRVGAPAGAGARPGLAGPDGRLPARLAGAGAAPGGVGEKSDLTGFGINLSGLVEGGLQRYKHSKTTFQETFAGIDQPLTLRARIEEMNGRTTILTCSLFGKGEECARGEVVAVRVPSVWLEATVKE